jgi:hypothetical protein
MIHLTVTEKSRLQHTDPVPALIRLNPAHRTADGRQPGI